MIFSHDVIACLLILGLIIAFVKLANRQQEEPEEDFETLDTLRLIREIDRLHALAHELQDCDDMLIDLRLCKHGESFRSFRMAWQSASGKKHEVDFLTDGSDLSAHQMLALAEAKREELNAEVAEKIAGLYALACREDYSEYSERRYKNGYKNDTGEDFDETEEELLI